MPNFSLAPVRPVASRLPFVAAGSAGLLALAALLTLLLTLVLSGLAAGSIGRGSEPAGLFSAKPIIYSPRVTAGKPIIYSPRVTAAKPIIY